VLGHRAPRFSNAGLSPSIGIADATARRTERVTIDSFVLLARYLEEVEFRLCLTCIVSEDFCRYRSESIFNWLVIRCCEVA